MILKPCPFCKKDIPRLMKVCPYCHRDEKGQTINMDSSVPDVPQDDPTLQGDLKALASDDPFARDQAVARVAHRGTSIIPALISILGDFSKPGLAGVATALGKIGDHRAIPVLAQAARMNDEELRIASVWALAQFHEPEVLPILLAEAERPHPILQSFLASILGTFQDKSVVPVLTKLIEHSNREVAFQAACALGEVGPGGIPALKKVWHRKDVIVRGACAASLKRLGSRPARFSMMSLVWGLGFLLLLGAGAGWFFYK